MGNASQWTGSGSVIGFKYLKDVRPKDREDPDTFHQLIEATKLAFKDGQHHITDMSEMYITMDELLSLKYAKQRKP